MKNILQEKSYLFALDLLNFYKCKNYKDQGYFLFLQLMKSGTSVGANIVEAGAGQSRKDFLAKMSIALKESKETLYWIRLLSDVSLLETDIGIKFYDSAEELTRILTKTIITTRKNLKSK